MSRLSSSPCAQRQSGLLSFGITLAVVPFLLAPVRFQQGQEDLLLTPSAAPAARSISLPAAVALTSPTVIPVSPTVLSATTPGQTSPTISSPSIVSSATKVPSNAGPTAVQAQLCQHGMNSLSQLAILSYQQQRQQGSMNLTIAAAAAAALAGNGQWPNLVPVQQAFRSLAWRTPQRNEITQIYQASLALCTQPGGANVRQPSGRISVPRPN